MSCLRSSATVDLRFRFLMKFVRFTFAKKQLTKAVVNGKINVV